jgi:hypothetical protein
MTRGPAVLALIATLLAGRAEAQAGDPRLAARLQEPARSEVQAVVEAAARSGVPTEPIVSKALEGVAKGAPADVLVGAVRALAGQLRLAQDVLGIEASEPEIVAAAALIRRGVSAPVLRSLHDVRPHGQLTVPFVAMGDLITAGMQPDSAAVAVLAVTRAGASDAEMIVLAREMAGARIASAGTGAPPPSGGGRAPAAGAPQTGPPPPQAAGTGQGQRGQRGAPR